MQHLASCPECSQSCDAISASKDLPVANSNAANSAADSVTPFYDEVTIAPSRQKDSPSGPVHEAVDEFATQAPAKGGIPANSEALQRSHFGRYRVEKLLGRGGFGEVYRAWDDQLKRPVAIKVTFQQFLTSGGKESYLAEAQTVASLDHPHIVPVFDVGQAENGDYYVVSKLIEGSDLAGRIGEQRPSRAESVAIIMSVAEALHHAYPKGMVHRDVKPANILIDSQDRAFLTDFGIALREVDFGRTEGMIGTRVVPRALRSFDQIDAEFFLELLPGPVDRMGLPDNIRFWKRKIESEDSEHSFSVGLNLRSVRMRQIVTH